jgi:hypothetical protein
MPYLQKEKERHCVLVWTHCLFELFTKFKELSYLLVYHQDSLNIMFVIECI